MQATCVPAFRARVSARCLAWRKLQPHVMDLVYLGVMVGFFVLTWGLALLGDRLAAGGSSAGEEGSR
jgi:hypothetical protein